MSRLPGRRGNERAGLVDPDLPGSGAPEAGALPHGAPAGAPRHLELGAPEPLAPFLFLPVPAASVAGRALPAPFAGFDPGLHVQHLLSGNLPPQPLHVCDEVQLLRVHAPVLT